MTARFYTFGPFRIDGVKRLLLRNGAPAPLTPKAFEILVVLLQRRDRVVEKDELLREVWRGIAVEENNLARNISTLRKALDDVPGQNRWIITIPGRGYQFVGEVAESSDVVEAVGQASPGGEATGAGVVPGHQAQPRPPFAVPRRALFAVAIVLAVAAGAGVAIRTLAKDRTTSTNPPGQMWQLTFAPGLNGEPTWSPDGHMVAFSSDRSGNLDIWVQPADGGNAVQVTNAPAHDWQPDWSRDGRRIVFRSERAGGGLYVVPALGGAEKQVATFGYHPRWSPDGTRILFHRSNFQGRFLGAREIYSVGLDGSPPTKVLAGFLEQFGSFATAWHPDSKRVSVWGVHRTEGLSFWTVPLDGGAAVKSEVVAAVRDGLTAASVRFTDADNVPLPFLWGPSGDVLYFEGVSRGVRNLWRVGTDPDRLEWRTGPQRLTTGAELNEGISLSADGKQLAFAVRSDRIRLWSFGLDAASGRLSGRGDAITTSEFDALSPVLSRDGTRLVFEAERGGVQELWLKTLSDGRETLLIGGDRYRRVNPVWSHDDHDIMYLRTGAAGGAGSPRREVVTIPVDGGAEQVLQTIAPFEMLLDWSSDGAWVLAGSRVGGHDELSLFPSNPKSGNPARVLATDAHSNLWKARLAPDQRWVTYTAASGPGVSVIYAVPAAGGTPVALTTGEFFDDRPRWSPDGRLVYFLSNRSGFFNVWARHFDPDHGAAVGEPFVVTSLDSPAVAIPSRMVQVGLAVAPNRLILPIAAVSGSIWILAGVDR